MILAAHNFVSKIWTNGSDKNGRFAISALHLGKTIHSTSFVAKNSSAVKIARTVYGLLHVYWRSNILPSNRYTDKYAIIKPIIRTRELIIRVMTVYYILLIVFMCTLATESIAVLQDCSQTGQY